MPSPQTQTTQPKPETAKPANGGAPVTPVSAAPASTPDRAARGTKVLSPLGYVNAVESARKRATGIEERLLKQVPEGKRDVAVAMLKANDGK